MIIADSDVLIQVLRGDEKARDRLEELIVKTGGGIFITPIQTAEIHAGMKPKEKILTEKLLNAFSLIPIDQKAGEIAGDLLRRYAPSHGITLADALIAAAAIKMDFHLWTRNRRHYPMFSNNDFTD